MRTWSRILVLFTLAGTLQAVADTPRPAAESVKANMKRVADWQIEHFGDVFDQWKRKVPYAVTEWPSAALYVGMLKWAEIAGDESYYQWMKGLGEKEQWTLFQNRLYEDSVDKRLYLYHADDHCVGQMYIELYRKYKQPEMIAPTIKQFDHIVANPSNVSLEYDGGEYYAGPCSSRWSWCDALFMAPPVLAKLTAETGDPKYLDFMMKEYKVSTDYLFDKEDHLFFRDNRFFDQKPHGKKIFWARGNGWVFTGLTLILPELEKGSEHYNYFLDLYKKMAARMIGLQTDEGYWAMSLLEADRYPAAESSGTGFFCCGLAWGINNGILDRETYEPVVLKAWDALVRCIRPEGKLGYVQQIGSAPGESFPDKTELYGTGAFLAAGAEVYKMMEDAGKGAAGDE